LIADASNIEILIPFETATCSAGGNGDQVLDDSAVIQTKLLAIWEVLQAETEAQVDFMAKYSTRDKAAGKRWRPRAYVSCLDTNLCTDVRCTDLDNISDVRVAAGRRSLGGGGCTRGCSVVYPEECGRRQSACLLVLLLSLGSLLLLLGRIL